MGGICAVPIDAPELAPADAPVEAPMVDDPDVEPVAAPVDDPDVEPVEPPFEGELLLLQAAHKQSEHMHERHSLVIMAVLQRQRNSSRLPGRKTSGA
jgi:hypothetical protein